MSRIRRLALSTLRLRDSRLCHVMMNSLSVAWRAVQDHGKVLTIAENKQCSTQKSSVKQIGDLAALFPPFREVDENEDQVRKAIEKCARTRC
jgi:hypothetical protein